jgi:hypothetical protein
MYADVLETYPCRREYLLLGRRYDAIWEHSRTSDMRSRREEMADLCLRMAAISEGRGDAYRQAMWQRRAYLHVAGDEGKVYTATDALLWKAKMLRLLHGGEIDLGAAALPEARRRILLGVFAVGDAGIPVEGVPRLTPLREGPIEGAA